MPLHGSPREREYRRLVDQLDALALDVRTARDVSHRTSTELVRWPAIGDPVDLSGGGQVLVRPVATSDVERLLVGFAHLSALSRYRRFRERIDRLPRSAVDALAAADHVNEDALVALDPVDGEAVGLAHYVRDPADPGCAEFDCTVVDEWQHRGVGSALFERLAERAKHHGIERLVARVVVSGDDARALIARIAEVEHERRDGGILEIAARLR